MDEITLAALQASIRHWEENVAAAAPEDTDIGPDTCALCDLFNRVEHGKEACKGCPVFDLTGAKWCQSTPHEAAWLARRAWRNEEGTRENWQLAAQRELDFLKSLLPKDAAP